MPIFNFYIIGYSNIAFSPLNFFPFLIKLILKELVVNFFEATLRGHICAPTWSHACCFAYSIAYTTTYSLELSSLLISFTKVYIPFWKMAYKQVPHCCNSSFLYFYFVASFYYKRKKAKGIFSSFVFIISKSKMYECVFEVSGAATSVFECIKLSLRIWECLNCSRVSFVVCKYFCVYLRVLWD